MLDPPASANRIHAREKWIGATFVTDGRDRSVSGIDFDVVPERQNLIEERVHQLFRRPARQVCSSDRTGEQTIAHEHLFISRLKQHNMPLRMAGTMNNYEAEFANLVDLAVTPMFVRAWRLFIIEAECFPLRLRNSNPGRLIRQLKIERLI